ncbi:MAG: thiamine diphosphokinase [Clostridia bacterium]|nr:thiamine diphosphokinase [Clostridia bacterium]
MGVLWYAWRTGLVGCGAGENLRQKGETAMSATCFIAGASPEEGGIRIAPKADDLVIAADGGYARLTKAGIASHVIIGDFDSLGFVPKHTQVLPHPKEKDDTDMMLAIRFGLSKGYQAFEIVGGLGGRIDHTIANIQAITFLARRGARGVLVDRNTRATVICSGNIEFDATERGTISVFALDKEVHGVTERGLRYPLTDATLTNAFPVGVSNSFVGEKSVVSVRDGTLLIITFQ